MECSELPHSNVLECFIKVNFGYDFLIEVFVNRTHWLDCIMSKWNFFGNFSYQEMIVHMGRIEAHKTTRI
jgi:hypothetical protein